MDWHVGGMGNRHKRKVRTGQVQNAFRDLVDYMEGNFRQIGETVGMTMEVQAAMLKVLGPETEEKVKEQVKVQIKEREERRALEDAKSKEQGRAQEPISKEVASAETTQDPDKTVSGIDPKLIQSQDPGKPGS